MSPYQRPDNLRKVAILVASVDGPLAEQLLAELPLHEAARVSELVDRLGEIDPEEQQDVLQQFQDIQSQKQDEDFSRISDNVAVEIDESLQRQIELLDQYEEQQQLSNEQQTASACDVIDLAQRTELLASASGHDLAELLRDEHPQAVALVLSRLSETKAAETLAHLPTSTKSLVVERLVYSYPAVDEAVEELETQLAERLLQRRRHQEYFQSGSQLAKRILQQASESERAIILDSLQRRDPTMVAALTNEPSVADAPGAPLQELFSPEPVSVNSTSPTPASIASMPLEQEEAIVEDTGPDEEVSKSTSFYDVALLEALDDRSLQALLAVANPQAVQIYLGTTSEHRFRRLTSGIPRREAKRLRKQLHSSKPAKEETIFQATQSLLEIANRAGLLDGALTS
ncbi:FliG C-terminal domain-containing protein [Adhaeretor mobilis]|uniref:Flagellar motor switch protein FliG n=1 Tax=Adhaeretor mobilis TaxID=1930276 RepID=A0A517MYT8_9BACT|nr:FliG C-terminal domain-containing protein [Adhaeretor mobilis]QDT00053.1 Flagellar motor switch protein FliG [Adhaeretor mobilis]